MWNWFWGCVLWLMRVDDRGIFTFHDGRRLRKVDPLEILRDLYSLDGFDFDATASLLKVANQKTRLEASGKIAKAVRSIFHIHRLDEGGLTETECVGLLAEFLEYCEDVKKNTEETPTSQPSTASEPSPAPTVESLIAAGWGSRSTPTDSSAGSPSLPDTGSLEHSKAPSETPSAP